MQWNHSVPVPALVDIATPKHDWKSFKHHWYRTTFDILHPPQLAFIVIEQAMFGTEVWLNGKRLGCDIACYTSQEYDARSALQTGVNELIVRVGQRENLPPHSAVGKDQERTEWIPGIWGDVYLLQCGNPRVKRVQVIPHIETSGAEVRVTIENLTPIKMMAVISAGIFEKNSGTPRSPVATLRRVCEPYKEEIITYKFRVNNVQLWSPENPFLYIAEVQTGVGGQTVDGVQTTFGMREFKIVGKDFFFNGKKIFLKGGNIAFHRFLSDADRGTLPWNLDWVKKLLIDIPKESNFNFFRNHIGQMYNRWYDIADEHGMLLQNEWMFWTTTGTKEQITKEFTRWLQDNWNHPSIVIWDALNECSDDVVQNEIVPEMKKLDPTRSWESVDFVEEHPYIYSLGPVLNDRKFGFTRSLDEIEHSSKPTMLNEFNWWWIDKGLNPSLLMKDVVERWLGPHWTKEQLLAHQSFLVTELVELFRRMRVDAIQPFVYLSNNAGPTPNWFLGNIKELQPKPILSALKNAFAPFGISIELWDRHFFLSENRIVRVFVFNDEPVQKRGAIRCGVVNAKGEWVFETRQSIAVEASSCAIIPLAVLLPSRSGEYKIRAELHDNTHLRSSSEKIAHIVNHVKVPAELLQKRVAVLTLNDEIIQFLTQKGIQTTSLLETNLKECDVLVVDQEKARSSDYQSRLGAITKFLESGKTVVLLEPEFEIEGKECISVALGVELNIEKRIDADKGGYDSYVFADDITHPLWQGMSQEQLKMFNGGYGGEIVSQHNVTPNVKHTVLARCGLKLGVIAACEIPVGQGKIIVSRLQVRGRLVGSNEPDSLYARRVDTVLQKYLLNLILYSTKKETADDAETYANERG